MFRVTAECARACLGSFSPIGIVTVRAVAGWTFSGDVGGLASALGGMATAGLGYQTLPIIHANSNCLKASISGILAVHGCMTAAICSSPQFSTLLNKKKCAAYVCYLSTSELLEIWAIRWSWRGVVTHDQLQQVHETFSDSCSQLQR